MSGRRHTLTGSLRGSPRAAGLLSQSGPRRLLLGALLLAAVLTLGWRPLLQSGLSGSGSAPGEQQQQRQVDRRAAVEVQPAAATVAVAAAVEADPAAAVQAAAAAVASSAGVHGYVTKEGPADPRNWHPDHKALREERLAGWLDERQAALADGAQRVPARLCSPAPLLGPLLAVLLPTAHSILLLPTTSLPYTLLPAPSPLLPLGLQARRHRRCPSTLGARCM